MVLLQVKWNKEKYELEVSAESSVYDFKVLLFSLTSVPLEKQKLICKGSVMKDEQMLGSYKIAEVMMVIRTRR